MKKNTKSTCCTTPVFDRHYTIIKNDRAFDDERTPTTQEKKLQPSQKTILPPKKPQLHEVEDIDIERKNNMRSSFDSFANFTRGITKLLRAILVLIMALLVGASLIVNSYVDTKCKIAEHPELFTDTPMIVELVNDSSDIADASAGFLKDSKDAWEGYWQSDVMSDPEADRGFGDQIAYNFKVGALKLREALHQSATK